MNKIIEDLKKEIREAEIINKAKEDEKRIKEVEKYGKV
jgi:hypothetical protein